MNNVYEFGGIADVLLKFKVEKEISGVHYAANEPYTFLKDVTVQFAYDQKQTSTITKKPVYAANEGRPTQITINGIPLTQKIANLVLSSEQDKSYIRTRREKARCNQDGNIELKHVPLVNDVFVYDVGFNSVKVTDINNTTLMGDFQLNEEYLIFYQQSMTGDKYSFEVPYFPYFELDIFVKGNTNKISNDIYMHFDAASLASVPNFNIMSGGILNTPLVFNIIYVNQEEPIIVFE